jgi:hypothetical protein
MPLTPEEEKRFREEIRKNLEKREKKIKEEKEREQSDRQRHLEERLLAKIKEEEEEKYFSGRGYTRYVNRYGEVEWLTPDEVHRRENSRRTKKPTSRRKGRKKKQMIRIGSNIGIVVIAAVAMLAILKFGLTKKTEFGALYVNSDIPGAQIYLDGIQMKEFTQDTIFKIKPGKHFVSIYKPGFTSWPPMGAISVKSNRTVSINFELSNSIILGKVTIESNNTSFDLYMDGVHCKVVGGRIDVPIGYHVFTAVKEGYITEPAYYRVLVEEKTPKNINFNFKKGEELGYLQISTVRESEYVYIDQSFTGVKANGETISIPAGTYEVTVRENGYICEPESRILEISPGSKQLIVFNSRPAEKSESLRIVSKKPGATVILNGKWLPFVTPILDFELSEGIHYLNLMRGEQLFSEEDIPFNLTKIKNNEIYFNF